MDLPKARKDQTMPEPRIQIIVRHINGRFFTNATLVMGEDPYDFVCTTAQSALDMSIASAMPFIRDYAAKLSAAPENGVPVVEPDDFDNDLVAVELARRDLREAASAFRELYRAQQRLFAANGVTAISAAAVDTNRAYCEITEAHVAILDRLAGGPQNQKKCYVCGGMGSVTRIKPDGSPDLVNLDVCFACQGKLG